MNTEGKIKRPFFLPTRSYNGTGITLLGYDALSSDTYEITRWITFLFVPLLPLSTWEIRPIQITSEGFPALGASYTFDILSKRRLKLTHLLRTYGAAIVAFLPIVLTIFLLDSWSNWGLGSVLVGLSIGWLVFCIMVPQQKHRRIYEEARVRAACSEVEIPRGDMKPNDFSLSLWAALKADKTNGILLFSPLILGFIVLLLGLLGRVSLSPDNLRSFSYVGIFVCAVCYGGSLSRGLLLQRFLDRAVLLPGVVIYMDFNENNSRANFFVPVYCSFYFLEQAYSCRKGYNFSDLDRVYAGTRVDMIVDPWNPRRALIRQMMA